MRQREPVTDLGDKYVLPRTKEQENKYRLILRKNHGFEILKLRDLNLNSG